MKNASLWALTGAGLVAGIAYACAVPVDVQDCAPGTTSSSDCVIITAASDFETPDASFPAQGGGAGSGGSNPPSGGNSGSVSPPAGGSAGSTSPPAGGSAGQGQGQAGSGSSAGAGGASGSAGSSAGTGGAAGSGTAGAGGTAGSGAAGMGGTTAQSTFNPAACDFMDRTGCEAQACVTACPTTDGGYCSTNCPPIITCVAANTACITEQDPLCGARINGTPKACTLQVEPGGGASSTDPNAPAFVARALVQCLCADPRP